MRIKIFITLAICILCFSVNAFGIGIEKSMLCSDVDERAGEYVPIAATNKFTIESKWAVMWVSFKNVSQSHTIVWNWHNPAGQIHHQSSFMLNPDNLRGASDIMISVGLEEKPANLPFGEWKLIVSLDDRDILEKRFDVTNVRIDSSMDPNSQTNPIISLESKKEEQATAKTDEVKIPLIAKIMIIGSIILTLYGFIEYYGR